MAKGNTNLQVSCLNKFYNIDFLFWENVHDFLADIRKEVLSKSLNNHVFFIYKNPLLVIINTLKVLAGKSKRGYYPGKKPIVFSQRLRRKKKLFKFTAINHKYFLTKLWYIIPLNIV